MFWTGTFAGDGEQFAHELMHARLYKLTDADPYHQSQDWAMVTVANERLRQELY